MSRIFARIFELISWTGKLRPWHSTSTSLSFPAWALYRLDDVVLGRPPDEPLRRVERVLRVELPLPLRLVAEQLVALLVDRVDRRDRVVAALVGDELHLPVAVGDGAAGVRGPEVDADDRVGGEPLHPSRAYYGAGGRVEFPPDLRHDAARRGEWSLPWTRAAGFRPSGPA